MDIGELVLPLKKIKAEIKSPKFMVVYSKPKAGKTTALSLLDNNLIMDFENGSDFVDAIKIKVDSIENLKVIGKKIIEEGKPYRCITVDTATALEDMIMPLAIALYQDTPMGKAFKGDNILKLANGAGYLYYREAFFKALDYISTLAPRVILSCHLKEKNIEINGKEVAATDIELTGKIKSLVCSRADAVALLKREGNKTILSFATSDVVTCGARPDHLKNKEIVLIEMDNEGKVISNNWNKVYID